MMSFLCTGVKAWHMGAQFTCWPFFPFVEQMCPVISPPLPPTLAPHPGKFIPTRERSAPTHQRSARVSPLLLWCGYLRLNSTALGGLTQALEEGLLVKRDISSAKRLNREPHLKHPSQRAGLPLAVPKVQALHSPRSVFQSHWTPVTGAAASTCPRAAPFLT